MLNLKSKFQTFLDENIKGSNPEKICRQTPEKNPLIYRRGDILRALSKPIDVSCTIGMQSFKYDLVFCTREMNKSI